MERRERHQLQVAVCPIRIVTLDQLNLPVAPPTLELLLKADRLGDLPKTTEEDQSIDAIGLREAGNLPRLMFGDASIERIGHADVERAELVAREDVDPVGVVAHGAARDVPFMF